MAKKKAIDITNKVFGSFKTGWVGLSDFTKSIREEIADWLDCYSLQCVNGDNDFAGHWLLWLGNDFLNPDEGDVPKSLVKIVELGRKQGFDHIIFTD